MKYLGIVHKRPRIAIFDFTSCEGCELQLANKEETLLDFLKTIEIIRFREVCSETGDTYQIAFIEGAITRFDEIERLELIRKNAAAVVALGSCACFGGVNRMKNSFDLKQANREIYGNQLKETLPTRSVKEIIKVDLEIPGCPISKREVERIMRHLILDIPYQPEAYPVCVECKRKFTVCMFLRGEFCLGPITRAGCDAPCPASGMGCWGCRGPCRDMDIDSYMTAVTSIGYSIEEVWERAEMYGGFEGIR